MIKARQAVITTKVQRAAQYLRVSTESQKYSIENQAAALAAYAARRGIEIIETYADRGRSGLSISGREALKSLIKDVELSRALFDCILVFDVTRWGRFQDVDESAYYEFICKRAGIQIHYCADEFENDGSLASVVLKNIKRVAAADYSRQLSKKVFLGQSRVASEGFWRGGPAPFGLRRLLVDERGRVKTVLQIGERKNLKSERTILGPGPKHEIAIVRRIFEHFATRTKTRTEIAADLNAKRFRNAQGKLWTMLTISNVLRNEAYLGHIVYNRRSMKLGERNVRNPPEMWIRHQNAFKPIIAPALFLKAQNVMAELESGRTRTDKELLELLKGLLLRDGRLTMKSITLAKDMPNASVFTKRFGSLDEAYRLIGYRPAARYRFKEVRANIDQIIRSVADKVSTDLERRGRRVSFLPELYLLTINGAVTLTIAVSRAVKDGTNGARPARRWELRKTRFARSDLTLVVRMNAINTMIQDYFLLPTSSLPASTGESRVRISERYFGDFRCSDLAEVTALLHSRFQEQFTTGDDVPSERAARRASSVR
ncbi:putative recombinase [Bradyrhizobium sp. ORS 278]|uniref:recombinase family protein n=1 Tax=Bradyrhizobium sp. (strain ORS 278) TaxID=114615 RepID=UPI000150784F|nr:recombinase family protein [Bradyrhizobium sp. ORS 278]CAL74430.1 putative recombinase [Bradyrhizobium sp. ORS 278]